MAVYWYNGSSTRTDVASQNQGMEERLQALI